MARRPRLGGPLQTLRNAPDMQDGERRKSTIVDVAPDRIETAGRFDDRLQIDVDGLKQSIAENGQRVPILLCPAPGGQYALIYGRRRLEACRQLGIDVRAIVADMEGDQALRDQLVENQERQPLGFIERALIAVALLEGDHLSEGDRTARTVAGILNLHEAGVSQLVNVVRTVGVDLIRAIGPAPGIGRPRWEELKKIIGQETVDRDRLVDIVTDTSQAKGRSSDEMFLMVLRAAKEQLAEQPSTTKPEGVSIELDGIGVARIVADGRRKQVRLDLKAQNSEFVEWIGEHGSDVISEMHQRWQQRKT